MSVMNDYYKNRYRIDSNRLNDWNYADFGCYYITLVTHNRVRYFGKIENGKMIYNDIGNIVNKEIIRSFDIRKELRLKEYVIMQHINTAKRKMQLDEDSFFFGYYNDIIYGLNLYIYDYGYQNLRINNLFQVMKELDMLGGR